MRKFLAIVFEMLDFDLEILKRVESSEPLNSGIHVTPSLLGRSAGMELFLPTGWSFSKLRRVHSRPLNTICIVPAFVRVRAIWIRVRGNVNACVLPSHLHLDNFGDEAP